MSQQPQTSGVNARGAVDLSQLDHAPKQPAAQSAAAGGKNSWRVAASPSQLQQVVQLSAQVPVLVLIHDDSAISESFVTTLQDAVDAKNGRIVLATLDAASTPELAQQAKSLPVVTAFLAGRPIGEFDSQAPVEQLEQVVEQILQLATQNGVTGTVPPQGTRADAQPEEEQPLPPLHQAAHDALDAGDYAAAIEAYEQAIKESPADQEAKLGLSQVKLMQRTQDVDLQAVRQQAADHPDDLDAQIQVADVDVLGGHVEDAFNRLIQFLSTHAGDDREKARQHLVELFSIVGDSDPRVNTARKALARALF